jgi:hypothetical protein
MWLKFVVVGLRLGPKSKSTETFLSSDINECPFNVSSQSLAAFSFPLGPDSQTPKDRMAPEVGLLSPSARTDWLCHVHVTYSHSTVAVGDTAALSRRLSSHQIPGGNSVSRLKHSAEPAHVVV